jgi:Zn-dependent protease
MSMLTKAPLFIVGWAKPVPVQIENLRNPKRDMLWVAAAGPMANLVMAIGWGFLLRVASPDTTTGDAGIVEMADAGVQVNLMLMALNLLPILPLDGGRIAVSLLPHRIAFAYARLERYGFMLVIILLVTGVLGHLMEPLLRLGTYAVASITGL